MTGSDLVVRCRGDYLAATEDQYLRRGVLDARSAGDKSRQFATPDRNKVDWGVGVRSTEAGERCARAITSPPVKHRGIMSGGAFES